MAKVKVNKSDKGLENFLAHTSVDLDINFDDDFDDEADLDEYRDQAEEELNFDTNI